MTITSVVDVGCGAGWWLDVFRKSGVEDIFGIDGHWIEETQVKIPPACFLRRELESEYDLDRRFDLAISLEVAEHLAPSAGAGFVAELCKLAPVVLFSGAIPHQSGPGHVNEQWPSYWARKFASHGYKPVDALRLRIWNEDRVAWWYRQNIVLYANDGALAAHLKLAEAQLASPDVPLDLVHPEMHAEMARRGNVPWRIVMSRQVRQGFKRLIGSH